MDSLDIFQRPGLVLHSVCWSVCSASTPCWSRRSRGERVALAISLMADQRRIDRKARWIVKTIRWPNSDGLD